MICPSCAYENFHPNATNCDLCHAVLKPDAAGGKQEGQRETERLVEELAGDKPAEPAKATQTKKKPPKAAAPKAKETGDREPSAPLDVLLFVLALPVTFPLAVWTLVGGAHPRSLPGSAWFACGAVLTGIAFALRQTLSGDAPPGVGLQALAAAALVADVFGSVLLFRMGEAAVAWPALALPLLGGGATLLGPLLTGGPSELRGHTALVLTLDVTADGKRAISGSEDTTAIVWDLTRGQRLGAPLSGHREGISSARLGPDGKVAITSSWDGQLKVWGGEPLAEQRTLKSGKGAVTCAELSRDGSLLAFGTFAGEVEIHDVVPANPPRVVRPRGHEKTIEALAFSPDGAWLATGASDGSLSLWETGTGAPGPRLAGHPKSVRALAFSSDSRQLFSAGVEGGVKTWDVGSGGAEERALANPYPELPVRSLAARRDGRYLLGVDAARHVIAWDLASGELAGQVELPAGRHPPSAVAWAGTDRCLVTLDEVVQVLSTGDLGVR